MINRNLLKKNLLKSQKVLSWGSYEGKQMTPEIKKWANRKKGFIIWILLFLQWFSEFFLSSWFASYWTMPFNAEDLRFWSIFSRSAFFFLVFWLFWKFLFSVIWDQNASKTGTFEKNRAEKERKSQLFDILN